MNNNWQSFIIIAEHSLYICTSINEHESSTINNHKSMHSKQAYYNQFRGRNGNWGSWSIRFCHVEGSFRVSIDDNEVMNDCDCYTGGLTIQLQE